MSETKASRQNSAALGALLGLMIYQPQMNTAKASGDNAKLSKVMSDFGQFILDMIEGKPERNSEQDNL